MNKLGLRLLRYLLLFVVDFVLFLILITVLIETNQVNNEMPGYFIWLIVAISIIQNILWVLIATKGKKAIQIICGMLSGCIIPAIGESSIRAIYLVAAMILSIIVFWELMNKLKVVSFENTLLSSINIKQKRFIWAVIDKIFLSLIMIYLVLLMTLNFPDKKGIFLILTCFISFLYGIGGYWFFNKDEKELYAIPILSGIVFGTSMETWSYSIFLIRERFDVIYLPFLNGLFFIFLILYIIKEKKRGIMPTTIRGILIRSFIILLVTVFLSYTPPTLNLYRKALYALNYGNANLQANLQIYDDHVKYLEAINKNDCNMAIGYAKDEMRHGFTWLFYKPEDTVSIDRMIMLDNMLNNDSLIQKTDREELFKPFLDSIQLCKIGGPIDDIYSAYKCPKKDIP